jgi:hypothetical protein
MDSADAFFKTSLCRILMLVLLLFLLFAKAPIGKFLDKLFPFPYLRKGGNYKYKDFKKEISYQGQILSIFFVFNSIFIMRV